MTGPNQQRSVSMRALVLFVALTGACAFQQMSSPSAVRLASFSAPRSLSAHAVVNRKTELSMKSAAPSTNVASTASKRSKAAKVRRLDRCFCVPVNVPWIYLTVCFIFLCSGPHTSSSMLLHPGAHTATNRIAGSCRRRCCDHGTLAHGSKDCQLFPSLWNSRFGRLGHHFRHACC